MKQIILAVPCGLWYTTICATYFVPLEVDKLAGQCEICGKGRQTGHKVSHSNIKTNRTWKPNIRKIRANINGTAKTIKICTRCLRAGKVQRAG